jgi:hypothetical protein
VRRRAVLGLVVCALFAYGCNNPDYDRETIEQELRDDVGLTAPQAACVAERLEDSVGVRRLGARDEPTPLERDKLDAAVLYAIVTCGDDPFDRAAAVRQLQRALELPAAEAQCLAREIERRAQPATPETIASATLACDGREPELRRNVGLSRDEAGCVLDGETVRQCTADEPTDDSTSTTRPRSTPSS